MFELKTILEILKVLSLLNLKEINFLLDKCINIEYDINSNNLILSFNKVFFKTFKNNILLNNNDILKIKNTNQKYNSIQKINYYEYKVFEDIYYDKNIIKISIPLFNDKYTFNDKLFEIMYLNKTFNFNHLKVLSEYIYNSYNFKGLNYNDKKIVKKVKNYTYYISNEYNKYIIDNSYYYKVNNQYRNKNKNNTDTLLSYIDIPINEYTYKYEYKNTYNKVEIKTINNKKVLKTFIDCLNQKNKGLRTFKIKNKDGIAVNVYFKEKLQFTLIFKYSNKSYYLYGIDKYKKFNNLFELISYYKFIDKNNKKFKDLKIIKI